MILITLFLALFAIPLVPVELKDSVALLAICCVAARLQYIKGCLKQGNPFLAALVVFLPFTIWNAPDLRLIIGTENVGGLWMWRGLAWCLGYYALYLGLRTICFDRERNKRMIALAVVVPAIISALYAYAQALGFDQWQYTRPYSQIGSPDVPGITAMIGNPTFLALYLAVCLPFAIAFFRWYWAVVIGLPILFLHSDTAIFGTILAGIVYVFLRTRKHWSLWLVAGMFVAAVSFGLVLGHRVKVNPNGRMAVWYNTIDDWRQPAILYSDKNDPRNQKSSALTGRGLGSFQYLYPLKHYSPVEGIWITAHNEYLEALYSIGLIGLLLTLGALGFMFWTCWPMIEDRFTAAVFCSAIVCAFSAFTLPVWHQEPTRFLSVVMFSLLSVKSRKS